MDFAIITMRIPGLNWAIDMELPVKISIADLNDKILDTLKKNEPETFQSISKIDISRDGKILNTAMSLSDYQIWDGSILEIIC